MKLRRLAIRRLPGIDDPFEIESLGDGFHVVVGPNGIGKSSLCRATRALLWRDLDGGDRTTASASFERDGASWSVERDGSRYVWQREGESVDPPSLPAERFKGCFFLGLRDLLEATADAGKDVAGEIRKQMSGGFDLEAAAADAFDSVSKSAGRSERTRLTKTEGEVGRAEALQADLERREAGIAALDARADAAELQGRRQVHFDTALELLEDKAKLELTQSTLDALPESLAKLSGSEIEQLDQREPEVEEKRRQRVAAVVESKAAIAAIESANLEQPLDLADLEAWRARADELAKGETRLEQAKKDLTSARAALAEAGRHLDSGADAPPDLDLEGDSDLFSFLREFRQAREIRLALDERLQLLVGRTFSEDDRRRLELLRRAIEPLRTWLRLPDAEETSGGSVSWLREPLGVLLAVALAAVGLLLAFVVHPALAAVFGVGLGAALVAWLLRADPGLAAGKERLKREFSSELDPPAAWETSQVTDRLRVLESEAAQLEASSLRARDRGVEIGDLENRRTDAQAKEAELEARRVALAAQLGLDEITQAAELVDTARSLDQLRRARELERSAAASVEGLESANRTLLEGLAAYLGPHAEAAPSDSASARASVARLAKRDQSLRDAIDAEARAQERIRDLDDEIEAIDRVIAKIYLDAGLERGDRTGLEQLLGSFDRYRELRGDHVALITSIGRSEAKLVASGEAKLASLEKSELDAAKEEATRAVAALDELRGDIADIRAEVKQAREGQGLEDSLAERDAALGALRDRRDEVLRCSAGNFLVESIRRQHETIQMPRVLERARTLFGSFTHQAYDLRVPSDESGSFIARDTRTGIGRSPDELSDGTRAQLLLAARLAFAEEIETGSPLPLFLDEAMDQSDPARFRAMTRSLGRMVEDEGRQIFYLTNDPTDVERIQEALAEEGCAQARTIDLARVRNQAVAVVDPGQLKVIPLAPIPSSAGKTPEGYGIEIGVPRLDPRRDHTAQHLFYLLGDDLASLHRLLESRIQHVGQWVGLSGSKTSLASQVSGASESGRQLDLRCALLEAFCRAWREGRGRVVDREALEASDAISDTFLERVVDIVGELDGDGDRLLYALRTREDERLRSFRSKFADQLEEFLHQEGYVDPEPILDEAGVAARCMASPVAARLPGDVVTELVHRWWVLSGRE